MDFRILLEKITPALKYIARKHLLWSHYGEDDLFQEMCLHLWQYYGHGLPIGINESYAIKGCEFHLQNFLRKGRPKAVLLSLDEFVTPGGMTFGEILEDKTADLSSTLENRLSVDEIRDMNLTDRERSVLSCLLKGCTVRETAKEIGISHVMVVKYKQSIIKKSRGRLPKG